MTEQEKKAMLAEMSKDKEGRQRKFWTLPSKFEGTQTIRILPPLKGEKTFYFSHKVNWVAGQPFEALDQTFYYPDGTVFHESQPDPINQFVKRIFRTSERGTDEWKMAQELNAKQRYVSRIVVRNPNDRDSELQPVFYEYGPTIFNMLYHIMTETDFGIIVDPKNGRDFQLTKAGTGRQSKYETSTPAANQTPIFEDADSLRKVFENASKMDYLSLIEMPSYEDKKRALSDYLGYEQKSSHVVENNPVANSSPQPSKNSSSQSSSNEEVAEEVNEKTAEDEEGDIDSILSEFANV